MRRHLTLSEAVDTLIRGRAIEQWLRVRHEDGDRIIQWVRIGRERSGEFFVGLRTVFDQGNSEFTDVHEFQSYDPDEFYESMMLFSEAHDALAFAAEKLGAADEKYVNDGLVEAEYSDFIAQFGFWPQRDSSAH